METALSLKFYGMIAIVITVLYALKKLNRFRLVIALSKENNNKYQD